MPPTGGIEWGTIESSRGGQNEYHRGHVQPESGFPAERSVKVGGIKCDQYISQFQYERCAER